MASPMRIQSKHACYHVMNQRKTARCLSQSIVPAIHAIQHVIHTGSKEQIQ